MKTQCTSSWGAEVREQAILFPDSCGEVRSGVGATGMVRVRSPIRRNET